MDLFLRRIFHSSLIFFHFHSMLRQYLSCGALIQQDLHSKRWPEKEVPRLVRHSIPGVPGGPKGLDRLVD